MARSFNGSTDIAQTGGSAYSLGNPALTLSAWFNVTSAVGFGTIVGSQSGDTALWARNTGHVHYFCHSTLNGQGSGSITTATWYHVALTLSGASGSANGYLNGVSDISGSTSTYDINAFLAGNDNSGDSLNGLVADCAAWTVVLTAAELKALANGARPGLIRPGSLLGWWPFDGLASPEPDFSGSAKNMTLTGTAKAFGPPVMPFTRRQPQFLTPSAAASFQAAWALNRNFINQGVAT